MRKYLVFISLITLCTASQASSKEAYLWLKKMAMVIKSTNYIGTFVYIHNDHIEAMRIIHRADQNGETERLLSLNGAPREIIRNKNSLTCILPDNKTVVVEKSRPHKYFPGALLKLDAMILKNYTLNVLGDDRVADRPTKVIAIIPRDQYRYGYRLWLDKANAILLKSDVINEKGVAVEQFMFTQLEFKDQIDDEQLKPSISGTGYKWYGKKKKPESAVQTKKQVWRVTKLPKGFKESMYMEHGMPTSRMPVEHMVFTDGLSSVSVYIEKPQKNQMPLKGTSNMGAVNVYGRIIALFIDYNYIYWSLT